MYENKKVNGVNDNKSALLKDDRRRVASVNIGRHLSTRVISDRDLFIKNVIDKISTNNINKHLKHIVKVRNPEVEMNNLNDTAEYIEKELNKLKLNAKKENFFFKKVQNVLFSNIIAYKLGKNKRKVLILTSHYDSHRASNGADDNASSVASMLEIAKLTSPLNLDCTIQFTFFTLEEYSMMGSYFHAKELSRKKDKQIIGAISLDGLGYTTNERNSQKKFLNSDYPSSDVGDFLGIISNEGSQTLLKLFDYNVKKYVPNLQTETLIVSGNGEDVPDTRRSDHTPFWDYGYKSIMVTDTCQFRNPYIHTMEDNIENLNFEFLTDATKATLATILEICLKR